MINRSLRYQKGMTVENIFPTQKGICSCGCGEQLPERKRKWFSDKCRINALNHFYVVKGDTQVIRENLYSRDQGFCQCCGVHDKFWEADHIIPIHKGGGGCTIENLQTLCRDCHKEKTIRLDRIPNRHYIQATRFDLVPAHFNSIWARHEQISENIERNAIVGSYF